MWHLLRNDLVQADSNVALRDRRVVKIPLRIATLDHQKRGQYSMHKFCMGVSSCSSALVSFWISSALIAHSQAINAPKHVEQWGIEEVTVRSAHPYDNPFKEVRLQGRFACGEQSLTVSGFYDGQQTWRIRFMPDQQGTCQYTTVSNDPELNNQSGSFDVGPASPANHGPVHVAKTYHFSYADGTPYFLLGTTLYNWLNRDEALQRETLDTLSKNPFTKI